MEGLCCHQADHGVGDLDFTAGTWFLLFDFREDFWLQDVAAGNDEVRGGLFAGGFFHHAVDHEMIVLPILGGHDAVAMDLLPRGLFNGENIAAATFVVDVNHLLQTARFGLHDHVGQEDGEGFMADEVSCTPDGMAQAQWFLLAGKARLSCSWQVLFQQIQLNRLAALPEGCLKFILLVEVVFDDRLVAARDKDQMFNASVARLVNHDLDQRTVNHRQHFLGHGLGGGEEPGAKTGDWKNGFANGSVDHDFPDCMLMPPNKISVTAAFTLATSGFAPSTAST